MFINWKVSNSNSIYYNVDILVQFFNVLYITNSILGLKNITNAITNR